MLCCSDVAYLCIDLEAIQDIYGVEGMEPGNSFGGYLELQSSGYWGTHELMQQLNIGNQKYRVPSRFIT